MKCEQVHESMLDLAGSQPTPEQAQHLAACPACATKLTELRSTMALLDGWQAPEPSPYFDARLHARLREEKEMPRGFFGWLKAPSVLRPLAAAAFTLIVAAGIGLYDFNAPAGGGAAQASPTPHVSIAQAAPEGSAVADLQTLDKNEDVLADFDLLDDLAANQQSTVPQQSAPQAQDAVQR